MQADPRSLPTSRRARPRAVLSTLASLAALVAGTTACQSLERVDECRALTKLANPVLADIDLKRADVRASTYRAISTEYEGLASSAALIKIGTKRFAEAVNDYERMLHEAARDARAFADALDAKDEAKIIIARVGASRTLRHEATALARIDSACRFR